MQLRGLAWWSAAIVAALVAAAVAFMLLFDLERYRDRIVAAISAAAGRPVTVSGRLSLALSLRPTLVAEQVALGNPSGFSRPDMLRIARLEAQASLWPLLQGRVEIERIALHGLDLLLERDASGAGNWAFGLDDGDRAGASLPQVQRLLIRDAHLAWRSGERVWTLDLARLEAQRRDGATAAELEGAFGERPLKLRAALAAAPARDGDAGPVVLARDLIIELGRLKGSGDLTVVLAPERPRVDGQVSLGRLDLDAALGGGASQDGRLIPDAPLDASALRLGEGVLRFGVSVLVAGGLRLENVQGLARLEDGRFELAEFAAGLAQGRLTAVGQAQERGGRFAAHLRLELAQAELAALLPDSGLAGRIDAMADLEGAGAGLRALVGSLAGEARLVGRDGRLAGRALDLAAADLVRLLAPWSERGADTNISCMLFASTIRQGRAQADALVVDADRVLVTGEGIIDLRRERLDLQLKPRPKDPSLFSLATPVNVRGPLVQPSIAPDEAGLVLGAAGALIGNLALPGAGLLLPFLSAGAADHPCAGLLASAAKPAERRPAPGKPAKQEEGGVGGFFRGLGRSIDRALGTGR